MAEALADATPAIIPELTLGTRLYMARKHAGLDQVDLARAVGVSRALVSMWERDLGPGPRVKQVQRWAEATGISMRWLNEGTTTVSASGYTRADRHLDPLPSLDPDTQPELPFRPELQLASSR